MHTMLIENICYAGNSNIEQFPDEISKYIDANNIKGLLTLVEQILKKERHSNDQ